MLDELARVLKPGGEIVLISRVGADAGVRRSFEHWFQPAARKLGWRSEFLFERYSRWTAKTPGMHLIERRAVPPFGHFNLIRFGKDSGAGNGYASANPRSRLIPAACLRNRSRICHMSALTEAFCERAGHRDQTAGRLSQGIHGIAIPRSDACMTGVNKWKIF